MATPPPRHTERRSSSSSGNNFFFLFQSSKFVNFNDYNNFLPSFQVQLPHDVVSVELHLKSHVTPWPLIGWLFGSTETEVWRRIVQLRVQPG